MTGLRDGVLLCPSMMCADCGRLEEEARALEEAGADILHVDIMDGRFVPNFAMGLQDLRSIAHAAHIPVDAHLMLENPGRYVELFVEAGARIVYLHVGAGAHTARALQQIAAAGAHPGLAVDPETPVCAVEPLLPLADYVLVMTVCPGFAGQRYLPLAEEKIARLARWKTRYHYRILADGACGGEVIRRLSGMGADGFVLGTSALFGKGRAYREILPELRLLATQQNKGERVCASPLAATTSAWG